SALSAPLRESFPEPAPRPPLRARKTALSAASMTDSAPDYRDTVFLPKTDFPMKAGLPQKEPLILAKWLEGDLEGQIRASRKGRDQFNLHDGPPYANGDMH